MTDIVALTKRLYNLVKYQTVPSDMTREDMSEFIAEGIRELYVQTGRTRLFSEDGFIKDADLFIAYKDTLNENENKYVLTVAQYLFYQTVQANYSDMVSFTTNAMSVTHGDKPFENLQTRIDNLEKKIAQYHFRMNRRHILSMEVD